MKYLSRRLACAASVVCFMAVAATADAAPMSASEILNTYNLVVFGDVQSSSHVDGRAFVSGDVTGGNYGEHINDVPAGSASALTVGGDLKGSVSVKGGLTVGGDIATSNLNYNGGGDIYVGGDLKSSFNANFNGDGDLYAKGSVTNGANINANGGTIYLGGTVQSGTANGAQVNSPIPASIVPDVATQAAEMKDTLTKYSSYLSSLDANSATAANGSKITFNATPDENGLAIFTINDAVSFFASAAEFEFALNGATSLVINVLGGADQLINISANFLNSIAELLATNTIWNFVDATEINIETQFGGSILALLAHVTNGNNIEGTLIAGSLTQNGEIHYNGNITVPVSQTPIPAALPLFAAALGGLAFAGRMRAKRRLAA
jgi:choice-of-anchor A domain-containing protein